MAQAITATTPSQPFTKTTISTVHDGAAPRLLFRLGYGGMAEVYLATEGDAAEPEFVVVKCLYARADEDPEAVQMFQDEARLALCLRHPNIVRSHRLTTIAGRQGLVMEFLEGQTLQRVLRCLADAGEPLPLELAVRITLALLSGLEYAHELAGPDGHPLGVVHRDVSPHNVFVTYDGRIKLLDFGIAKTALQEGRTRTGLLKGKVSYMAPEQARGEVIDRRADLWSVGVVLWELFTSRRLFKAANEAAALNLTLSGRIPSARGRRPDLPPELEQVLLRALSRDRERRYASAREMRRDLEAWLAGHEHTSSASLLPALMKLMFEEESSVQADRVRAALSGAPAIAPPQPSPSFTLTALSASSVPSTPASSMTDLVQELTRQRRATLGWFAGLALGTIGAFFVLGYWFHTREGAVPRVAPQLTAAPAAPAPIPPPPTRAAEPAPSERAAPSEPPPAPTPQTAPQRALRRRTETSRRARQGAAEEPTPEPPESGLLTLDTTPWSVVSRSGKVLGQTPLVGVRLPAGKHTLLLENPELGVRTSYEVVIEPGKTTARRIGLD